MIVARVWNAKHLKTLATLSRSWKAVAKQSESLNWSAATATTSALPSLGGGLTWSAAGLKLASLHLDEVLRAARKQLIHLEGCLELHRCGLELHGLPAPDLSKQRPQPELLFIRIMPAPAAECLGSKDKLASTSVVDMRQRLSKQPLCLLGTRKEVLEAARAVMSRDLTIGWQLYLVGLMAPVSL